MTRRGGWLLLAFGSAAIAVVGCSTLAQSQVHLNDSPITASGQATVIVIGSVRLPPDVPKDVSDYLLKLAALKREDTSNEAEAERQEIAAQLLDTATALRRRQELIAVLLKVHPLSAHAPVGSDLISLDDETIRSIVGDLEVIANSQANQETLEQVSESTFALGLVSEWYDFNFTRALSYYERGNVLSPTTPKYKIAEARVRSKLADFDGAIGLLLDVEAGSGQKYTLGVPELTETWDLLGNIYWAVGQFDKAEAVFQKLVGMLEQLPGEVVSLAQVRSDVGLLLWKKGDVAKADGLLGLAVSAMENETSPAARATLAHALNIRASMYVEYGLFAHVEEIYTRAESLFLDAAGRYGITPDVASVWNNIALFYRYQGKYQQASELNFRAALLFERVLGSDHPNVATSKLNQASVECRMSDRLGHALELAKKALGVYLKVLPDDHPNVARALSVIAYLKGQTGDVSGAYADFGAAIAIQRARNPHGLDLAVSLVGLGGVQLARMDTVQAGETLAEAVAITGMHKVRAKSVEKYARARYAHALRVVESESLAAEQERLSADIDAPEMAYCVR
jgi:tetratricopeptide (TPR) repeat protein